MRKQSALLFILVCAFAACSGFKDKSPPTFRLAAWNIRIFSNRSRTDDELHHIAKVLIGYDFIAIVELRDEAVLMRTEEVLKLMGRDYDYLMSPPVGARVKERYAFLLIHR